ncbi:glycosyltransferase family 4 protein [Microbulbifer sp. JTAC008]|uniref:glycosyltransferase family 4 protein n=1 Tax=unclassified Microbulbifer TaxID=2619833 RepID=UPI0040391901
MSKLIILSVDYFPKIGGISLMTHHLANGFCQVGWDVTVVAPADSLVPKDYIAHYKLVADLDSRPELRGGVRGAQERKRIKSFLNSLGMFDQVLLLHPFYYGIPALEFARENGIRISCYFHGFELKSQILHVDKFLHKCLGYISPFKTLRQQTLGLVKEVDFIFTNSSETSGIVKEIRTDGVFVTGCGLDADTFTKMKVVPVSRFQLRNEYQPNKVLGFVGRLVESKNVSFLLELLKNLPEYELLVVGDGPDADKLKALALKLDVDKRVAWLGKVSEEEKWKAIDNMDLLCLPSKRLKKGQVEGFGIVMLEATMRGVPIAVSHEGGMRDFVLENNGMYLDINSVRDSSEKVSAFLGSKDTIIKAVMNAQRLIQENLTYDKIARNIAGVMRL